MSPRSKGLCDPRPVRSIPIDWIRVGKRHRRELGDLDGLVVSMREVGQLQPVGLRPDMTLVFGARRLAAARKLGWEWIDARIFESLADAASSLRAERDENLHRQDMLPSELVSLGEELEAVEREAAKQRQGRPGAERSGKLPEHTKGQARDRVAEALGLGGRTYEKAKQVAAAAEAEPDQFGDLTGMMDGTSVDAAYRELMRRQHPLADPPDDPADGTSLQTPPRPPLSDSGEIAQRTAGSPPVLDERSRPVPTHLVPVFADAPELFGRIEGLAEQFPAAVRSALLPVPCGRAVRIGPIEEVADALRQKVQAARPYCVCPACFGAAAVEGGPLCPQCERLGWLTRAGYEALPDDLRRKADGRAPMPSTTPWDPAPGPVVYEGEICPRPG
jgi:hypothetical protein